MAERENKFNERKTHQTKENKPYDLKKQEKVKEKLTCTHMHARALR